MKIAVVKGPMSKLAGARCRHCSRPVQAGHVVLWQHVLGVTYGEDRFVVHLDCMAALVEKAPEGKPAAVTDARFCRLRRQIQATGDPCTEVA